MKTNIRKTGLWWKWDEFCDNCGTQIRGESFASSAEPEKEKEDYCLDCMRKKLDDMLDSK